MKKLLALILAALMLISLVACNETGNNDNGGDDTNESIDNNVPNDNDNNDKIDKDDLNDMDAICDTHNYIDNICSVCGCLLWNGESDTSWYSVVETEFAISTGEQLKGLALLVNEGTDFHKAKITLAANLDLGNKDWSPIGIDENCLFKGVFDGAGYTISNFSITNGYENANSQVNMGLFAYSSGTIKNLDVKNFRINTTTFSGATIGGLVGCNSGTVEYCNVEGTIDCIEKSRQLFIGGIAGYNTNCISNSCSNVNITGINEGTEVYKGLCVAGGLVGRNFKGAIENSSSTGTIYCSSVSDYNDSDWGGCNVGGLVGISGCADHTKLSTINNCFSNASVTAIANDDRCSSGGLVGTLDSGVRIYNSYSTGSVNAISKTNKYYKSSYTGGIAGYIRSQYFDDLKGVWIKNCWTYSSIKLETNNEKGYAGRILGKDALWSFENCYYAQEQAINADNQTNGGTPASANDFMMKLFYTNIMLWDSEIWNIIEGEFPTLK